MGKRRVGNDFSDFRNALRDNQRAHAGGEKGAAADIAERWRQREEFKTPAAVKGIIFNPGYAFGDGNTPDIMPVRRVFVEIRLNGGTDWRYADIGIAGGKETGLLFKKGKMIRTVPQDQIVEVLKEEILKMI